MLDLTRLPESLHRAVACAAVTMGQASVELVRQGRVPKGDPLTVARVAAVQAAKDTGRLIPHCRTPLVEYVGLDFSLGETEIGIRAEVKAGGREGVATAALCAAAVAALTIYDMLKMVDETLGIEGLRLLEDSESNRERSESSGRGLRAAVLVLSDSISRGENEDTSGKVISARLAGAGFTLADYRVIPDEPALLRETLVRYADSDRLDLVLTSGGTGLGPRDSTPETTLALLQREVPGIEEAARAFGQRRTPLSMLSRGAAGFRGQTLIVNLPGSVKAVTDYLDSLLSGLKELLGARKSDGELDKLSGGNG
ncbi:MAG: hypothetical protein A3F83_12830 [Candidatus Glassbacteria bacterium RIFCSPLOWO2_12_FULL_58_11]|uniref:MoaB/Mog domain-containing protein n=1 Tax=Candidatus Glassbacteria bacterium RIFCSPLOWO2_12_FULL_58_11 TaxID=1817867 RepID=A0A1F5YM43_9BACT|nr:MAG: hypothetical protein A3F83_12830 [Candidatus Glassbacteria bacterium RIFCSPLOWO2_12_FULL_58_11]